MSSSKKRNDLKRPANKVGDINANPTICCSRCQEEDDEHDDAIQSCQYCQLPLCDGHVILHQKNKKTKDHTLLPIDQIPNYQKHKSHKHKKIDQVEEESLQITNNADSKQCLEHYNSNKNENLDL